jgi:hypothetical protein
MERAGIDSPGKVAPTPKTDGSDARRIPIRVIGYDQGRVEFSEDTKAVVVGPWGARIGLKNRAVPDDVLRIVNLENSREADFRLVGPIQLVVCGTSEWAVECLDRRRNIWGVTIPILARTRREELGPWLECRACATQFRFAVGMLETLVLDTTGLVVLECHRCGRPTYWTYAEASKRPPGFPPFEDVAPPPRKLRAGDFVNQRALKRLSLRLAVLIRNHRGQEEVTTAENVSRGGFAAVLGMELRPGQTVTCVCPYAEPGQNIERVAECRWEECVTAGATKRIYGFRYI